MQLINGVHLYDKMRKSLGSKRNKIGDDGITLITKTFGAFEPVETMSLDKEPDAKSNRGRKSATKKKAEKKTFGSKIFQSHEFGYRRIAVERPQRLSAQFTDERIETLRFMGSALNAVTQKVYELFGESWTDKNYGDLSEVEADVRALVKADFKDLKEKYVKDLLDAKKWTAQKEILDKAAQLQKAIGTKQSDDFNAFEKTLSKVLKDEGIKLDNNEKKQILAAITWTNPAAEPVIKKVLKKKADPMYGTFEYKDQVVQFQPDSSLRDNEDVPLTEDTARGAKVNKVNEAYFNKEVAPHVADAWIDSGKCDGKDEQVGVVGYEIPFNRHFYVYEPPRPLAEIDADLDVLSAEIMEMLREVRS